MNLRGERFLIMLINSQMPDAEKYEIVDCRGNKIPYVTAFDTETNEIELAIRVIPKEGSDITFLSELNGEDVPSECLLHFVLKGAKAQLIVLHEEPKSEAESTTEEKKEV